MIQGTLLDVAPPLISWVQDSEHAAALLKAYNLTHADCMGAPAPGLIATELQPLVCFAVEDRSWPVSVFVSVNGGDAVPVAAAEVVGPFGLAASYLNLTHLADTITVMELRVWAVDAGDETSSYLVAEYTLDARVPVPILELGPEHGATASCDTQVAFGCATSGVKGDEFCTVEVVSAAMASWVDEGVHVSPADVVPERLPLHSYVPSQLWPSVVSSPLRCDVLHVTTATGSLDVGTNTSLPASAVRRVHTVQANFDGTTWLDYTLPVSGVVKVPLPTSGSSEGTQHVGLRTVGSVGGTLVFSTVIYNPWGCGDATAPIAWTADAQSVTCGLSSGDAAAASMSFSRLPDPVTRDPSSGFEVTTALQPLYLRYCLDCPERDAPTSAWLPAAAFKPWSVGPLAEGAHVVRAQGFHSTTGEPGDVGTKFVATMLCYEWTVLKPTGQFPVDLGGGGGGDGNYTVLIRARDKSTVDASSPPAVAAVVALDTLPPSATTVLLTPVESRGEDVRFLVWCDEDCAQFQLRLGPSVVATVDVGGGGAVTNAVPGGDVSFSSVLVEAEHRDSIEALASPSPWAQPTARSLVVLTVSTSADGTFTLAVAGVDVAGNVGDASSPALTWVNRAYAAPRG